MSNRQPLKQETKDKISAALRGRKASEETRAKMRKSQKDTKRPGTRLAMMGNTHGVGRKDSEEAIERKRDNWSGSNNPNWKGGSTKEIILARNCSAYDEWRNKVYERDNYTCRACEATKSYLNAHHVKPFAKFHQFRYDVTNGITLCEKCHKLIHRLI